MQFKKRILIPFLIAAVLFFGVTSIKAEDSELISGLNLTKDQVGKIEGIVEEFSAKALDMESELDQAYMSLGQELKREDRFATDSKARAGARNFNKMMGKAGY
jgi:hypothetical protein